MSSVWELSTDNIVTAGIILAIGGLAIAWLLAGRGRRKKGDTLENRRLAGRDATVIADVGETDAIMSEPPVAPAPSAPETGASAAPVPGRPPPMDAGREEPLVLGKAPGAGEMKAPRSVEQENAMAITAALLRRDKRGAPPVARKAQPMAVKPTDGAGDDLTAIGGIDKELARKLNEQGVYFYEQISNWSPDHAAWIVAQLDMDISKAQRDAWSDEAKALAAKSDAADKNRAG